MTDIWCLSVSLSMLLVYNYVIMPKLLKEDLHTINVAFLIVFSLLGTHFLTVLYWLLSLLFYASLTETGTAFEELGNIIAMNRILLILLWFHMISHQYP